MQELAKIRAFDKLFFDTGVEEEDIMHAFVTHRIGEHPAFLQIMAESKSRLQEKVQILLNKLAAPAHRPSTNPVVMA